MTHESKETVVITQERYDKLLKAEDMLNALHAAGVDNWEGFSEAYQYLRNDEEMF